MKMNNDTDKKAISKLDLEMHSENCQTAISAKKQLLSDALRGTK